MQRILVRNGVSIDLCSLLIRDIKASVEYFKSHPITNRFPRRKLQASITDAAMRPSRP